MGYEYVTHNVQSGLLTCSFVVVFVSGQRVNCCTSSVATLSAAAMMVSYLTRTEKQCIVAVLQIRFAWSVQEFVHIHLVSKASAQPCTALSGGIKHSVVLLRVPVKYDVVALGRMQTLWCTSQLVLLSAQSWQILTTDLSCRSAMALAFKS